MSSENVEIVRRFFEAIEQSLETHWENPRSVTALKEVGDLPPEGKELFAFMDPAVEWETVFAGVTFRGHLEVARGMDWLLEAAEDLQSHAWGSNRPRGRSSARHGRSHFQRQEQRGTDRGAV